MLVVCLLMQNQALNITKTEINRYMFSLVNAL